jgi:hypothetical protein
VAGSCVCGFLGVGYLDAMHMYFFVVCKGNSADILSFEIVNETTNCRSHGYKTLDFLGLKKIIRWA